MARSDQLKCVVVGPTGLVGREMLYLLKERGFPAKLDQVASGASGGESSPRQSLAGYDFRRTGICLMATDAAVSEQWAPIIAEAGAIVIDNSSAWRMNPQVPLVVPAVNGAALGGVREELGIVANPNCTTAQLVMVLKPLHDVAGVLDVVVSTYQSVSGAGRDALNRFESGGGPRDCVPLIDELLPDGFSREEEKMREEIRRIISPGIRLVATCVRVPVARGHGASVRVRLGQGLWVEEAARILRAAPGVAIDRNAAAVTQAAAVGYEKVLVSRIRVDPDDEDVLHFWCVADNLWRGAALNAVEIAEELLVGGIV